MTAPAVGSSFDVAYWLIDRALNDNEYLQPQKLHRLMFLAQAYFAVAYRGRMLMPAVFVADPFGPIEPNVFRACAIQRPPIEPAPLPDAVTHFLDSVWRRFGHHAAEFLNKQVSNHPPYAEAYALGPGSEITVKAMMAFYGQKPPAEASAGASAGAPAGASAGTTVNTPPSVTQVMRPRVMRSQSGKPVSVQKWMPSPKTPAK